MLLPSEGFMVVTQNAARAGTAAVAVEVEDFECS